MVKYIVYSYGTSKYPADKIKVALRYARNLSEMKRRDNFFIGRLNKTGQYETIGVAYWIPEKGAYFQKDTQGKTVRFIRKDGTLGSKLKW